MEFGLKRLVMGSSSFLPISPEQYQEIAQARTIIREALNLEQKFEFVVENYVEFEETLFKSGIHDIVLGMRGYQWFHLNRATFDRRIMNLLTTAISYTDSAKHHLNIIFSRDRDKVNPVMESYSAEYDSRIGFRTMCKLRNFVQHQGLPVHGSTFHSCWIERDGERKAINRNTVDPYIRPDELRSGDFNKTILKELEELGEKIDLKFLVRDYVEGLSAAHATVRQYISESVITSNHVLESTIKYFQDELPAEKSILGLAAVRRNENGSYEDDLAIIRDPNEYRAYLEKKNPSMVNLTRRYVSSEVVRE